MGNGLSKSMSSEYTKENTAIKEQTDNYNHKQDDLKNRERDLENLVNEFQNVDEELHDKQTAMEDKTRELDDKKSKIESLKTTLNASIKSIGEATRDLVPSGSSYSSPSTSSSSQSCPPFLPHPQLTTPALLFASRRGRIR